MSTLKRFERYEIHPVVEWVGNDLKRYCEAIEREDVAEHVTTGNRVIWTLYGHIKGEGLRAVSDLDSEIAAIEMLYQITGLYGEPGNYGTYEYSEVKHVHNVR